MTSVPTGILCAAVTPFGATGEVDLGALRELVGRYVDAGVQGIFAAGTASEAMLLDEAQRRRVAETVVDEVGGRCGLLLHVGAPDTATTLRLARHGAEIGVRAVAAIAPYYWRYSPADLIAHYTAVAEAVPDLDVFVYDNPERVGYGVGVDTVGTLVRTVPNVVGVKDTGDSVGRVMRYLASDTPTRVYTGNNELIFASLAVGADGAVSALAAAVPELVTSVYDRWRAGDVDGARAAQLVLVRLMAAVAPFPYIGAIKALAALRGLPAGSPRSPQPALDEAAVARLRDRVAAVDGLTLPVA